MYRACHRTRKQQNKQLLFGVLHREHGTSKIKRWHLKRSCLCHSVSRQRGAGSQQARDSCLRHEIHFLTTRHAIARSPTIHKLDRTAVISVNTAQCLITWCGSRTISSARCPLGTITGCFSSKERSEKCSRPRTRSRPSSSKNGVSLWIGEVAGGQFQHRSTQG